MFNPSGGAFDPLTADPRNLVSGGFSQGIDSSLAQLALKAQIQEEEQRRQRVLAGLMPPATQNAGAAPAPSGRGRAASQTGGGAALSSPAYSPAVMGGDIGGFGSLRRR